MKKLAFLMLALSFLGGMVFASGDNSDSDGKTQLNVFHYLDKADDVSAGNFQEVLKAFEEANPDIQLNFDYLVNEPYHNKLQAMNISDQLPDLVFLWPGKRTGNVTGSGKIKDLRPWLNPHKDEFAPAAVAAQGPNGEIYELPEQVTATHVMFTNTALLKELGLSFPKTFQELLSQSDKIQKAGYIPIAMDNKAGWQMQSTLLSALVERTAGRKWLEAARRGDASFSDPEFVNALEVIKVLSDKKMFSPGVNQAEYGRALTDFVNGQAVYFIDGGWRAANIRKEASEEFQKALEFHVFPKLKNEKGQPGSSAIIAGTGFGMNANLEGEKAEAAWKWIWFFSGPGGGKIKLKQGWLPAYKITGADLPIITKKLSDFLANTPGGYVIDGIMDAEGMSVLHADLQEMMFGNKTPQQVADNYEKWVAANDSGRK